MVTRSLIRALSVLDSDGKLMLPRNILTAMNLKEKDVVELKLVGSSIKTKKMVISKCQKARSSIKS